jgi:hypothetical protein
VQKVSPNLSATIVIFKQPPEEKFHPMGKNSPNLVTLAANPTITSCKASFAFCIYNYNAGVEAVNSEVVGFGPGAKPTIVSYNATSSLLRF